ncbi:D-alanine--D-alanine ligase [candidate division KSB1 bacterium]
MTDSAKKRIGIIFGGRSSEHEVSIMSARSIMDVIDKDKYDIELFGITKTGHWIIAKPAYDMLDGKEISPYETVYLPLNPADHKLLCVSQQMVGNPIIYLKNLDVVFPVLHGPYGEDGTIQGIFEIAGIPYVGCGVAASALGMDKILMKNLFIARGLPTVDSVHFTAKAWQADNENIKPIVESKIGFPCFVKPANTGSSVGITKVHDASELENALKIALEFDRKVLIEKGIDAREIECSVLGNDDPKASALGEVVPSREFYDYEAKYHDEKSELIIPADLPENISKRIKDLAVLAFKALDCCGMARVDFLLDKNTNDIYINEINTIPGFTSISMYSKLWEITGISYPELVEKLINLALERFEENSKRKTSYGS